MRPEVVQKINQIIEANVAAGFVRGQDLFAESLNEDLQKSAILESASVDGIIEYLLDDAQKNVQ